jgi:hypothetical protein
LIIDNYIDESVLAQLTKRQKGVTVTLLSKHVPPGLELDVRKYNEQHPAVEVRKFDRSHDRFVIIDDTEVYHLGASLKDLGKKWFAFSKMDIGALELLTRLPK